MGITGRLPWGVSGRTVGSCTTCWGMFGSGRRTAGTTITTGLRRMGARGRLAIVPAAFSAAAPGTALRGSSARRTAAGTRPGSASTASASVLPGRLPLESLLLYLFGGAGGLAPRSNFFAQLADRPCADRNFGSAARVRGAARGERERRASRERAARRSWTHRTPRRAATVTRNEMPAAFIAPNRLYSGFGRDSAGPAACSLYGPRPLCSAPNPASPRLPPPSRRKRPAAPPRRVDMASSAGCIAQLRPAWRALQRSRPP